ncbi:hypothetical protein [Deefgea rivuli]|uniref:hypothetical protein n=1 Tax=Deefgea rivuli TaxID=400948 RepID=UPI000481E3F0|nr:hypothetical protein [Deefgea rivuli]
MFRILALLLGLGFLYIKMSDNDAMSFSAVVFAVILLVYALGGAKWVGKINSSYNSNPIDEFKAIIKGKTPPKT